MRNKQIQIRVSGEFKARVKKAAAYRNITVSEYITKSVEKSLSDIEDIKQGKTQVDVEGMHG